ncbi:GSCOCG00009365001-RA-CDS [Cotesia congregata]|nr:GSCOCG00009365001-RA-CDS [Cotesia congregata]
MMMMMIKIMLMLLLLLLLLIHNPYLFVVQLLYQLLFDRLLIIYIEN